MVIKLKPKFINGQLWIPEERFGGYFLLPESDPRYREILLRLDSERFAELIEWCYNGRNT
jgi:hypothetical protein